MNKATIILGGALTLFGNGCDVADLVPTTAAEAGKASARVAVVMEAVPSSGMEAEVVQFELTVVDVLLHRVEDDMWIIANDGTGHLRAGNDDAPLAFTGLPMGLGDYDAILVAFDGARVAIDGRWVNVELTANELELAYDWSVADETRVELVLDLEKTLASRNKTWVLNPKFTASAHSSRH